MFTRLRSTWTAGSGALLLVLVLSGIVAGASLVAEVLPPAEGDVAPQADTTYSWEDVDGNNVDDDCQDGEVTADAEAVLTADEAVDLDGDGVVSVSEAAQSERIGGKNCNHGGYVSIVAHGEDCVPAETTPTEEGATNEGTEEGSTDEGTTLVVAEPLPDPGTEPTTCAPEETTEEAAQDSTTECVEIPPPDRDPALDTQKNGHGKWVSIVARSNAIGGKNCNHGGAVSEAAKDKTASDAAKAAAKAERAAAKAERAAAREAAKAARDAAKAAKQHGKKHGG
jgi:hypothetical protein